MASFASASSASLRVAAARSARRGLAAGDVVGGKYLLVRRRAQGARSTVWEAEHLTLRRRCALKILDTSGNARLPRAAEVRATAALDHPCITRLHDVFAEHQHDVYVFAMPLLEGNVLERILTVYGRMTVPRIASLMTQLLEGLVHALAYGVTFPVVSTRQIFVVTPRASQRRENVKLLGFGRPVPYELACADALLEGEVVRAVFGVFQESVASMPSEVDALFSNAKAQPSLAETRRIFASLSTGGKARG